METNDRWREGDPERAGAAPRPRHSIEEIEPIEQIEAPPRDDVLAHTHAHGGPAPAGRGAKRFLVAVMAVFIAATVAGAVLLWPHDGINKQPWLAEGASLVTGTVAGIVTGDQGNFLRVHLDGGPTVDIPEDPTAPVSQAHIGQRVKAIQIEDQPGLYIFMDYERGAPMLLLVVVFVIIVVAVARWKGLAALVGLAVALTLTWVFTLPALATAKQPLLVALVTASMVMFVVVYLAHGVSVKSTTALISTFVGIAGVAALAWWAIPGTRLTPLQDENMGQLPYIYPGVDVRGVLLCGMVLAGVGVLNDVTITQASAVWELRAAAPGANRRTIFSHAMKIGRDHIASTVYTIAFAYVGTAVGLLMLAARQDFSVLSLLTFNTIAQEVVATLVASISLVGVIPVTTALAAWLVGPARSDPLPQVAGAG